MYNSTPVYSSRHCKAKSGQLHVKTAYPPGKVPSGFSVARGWVDVIFWMLQRGFGEEKSLSPLPGIEQSFLGLPARLSVATMTEISVFRGEKQTRTLILWYCSP